MKFDPEGIEGDHVVVVTSEELTEVLRKCHAEFTKAILIVNSNESFCLDETHLTSFHERFPVLIIKQSDGKQLVSIMNSNLMCKCDIEVESTVDISWPEHQSRGMSQRVTKISIFNYVWAGMGRNHVFPFYTHSVGV